MWLLGPSGRSCCAGRGIGLSATIPPIPLPISTSFITISEALKSLTRNRWGNLFGTPKQEEQKPKPPLATSSWPIHFSAQQSQPGPVCGWCTTKGIIIWDQVKKTTCYPWRRRIKPCCMGNLGCTVLIIFSLITGRGSDLDRALEQRQLQINVQK